MGDNQECRLALEGISCPEQQPDLRCPRKQLRGRVQRRQSSRWIDEYNRKQPEERGEKRQREKGRSKADERSRRRDKGAMSLSSSCSLQSLQSLTQPEGGSNNRNRHVELAFP